MLPPFLTDVNVPVQIVAFLRSAGVDVLSAYESGWADRSDVALLDEATRRGRFVLTHDADFGKIAIAQGHPFHGILFVRPGDDPPDRVIASLRPLLTFECDWSPPLLAVVRRGKIRLRRPS